MVSSIVEEIEEEKKAERKEGEEAGKAEARKIAAGERVLTGGTGRAGST